MDCKTRHCYSNLLAKLIGQLCHPLLILSKHSLHHRIKVKMQPYVWHPNNLCTANSYRISVIAPSSRGCMSFGRNDRAVVKNSEAASRNCKTGKRL